MRRVQKDAGASKYEMALDSAEFVSISNGIEGVVHWKSLDDGFWNGKRGRECIRGQVGAQGIFRVSGYSCTGLVECCTYVLKLSTDGSRIYGVCGDSDAGMFILQRLTQAAAAKWRLAREAAPDCDEEGNVPLPLFSPTCPAGHPLQAFGAFFDSHPCDGCRAGLAQGTKMFGCTMCNYDLCESCAAKSVEKKKIASLTCTGLARRLQLSKAEEQVNDLERFARLLLAANPAAAFSPSVLTRNAVLKQYRTSAHLALDASPSALGTYPPLARNTAWRPRLAPVPIRPTMAVAAPTDMRAERLALVKKSFDTAEHMDVFVDKLTTALKVPEIGINGDNAIAITTLCRDECVRPLQEAIEGCFGMSFNAHGLGGLVSLGKTGMGAAMSHSPNQDGRERYVFFAISHIAIDSEGKIGAMDRPGRAASSACGALLGSLGAIKGAAEDLSKLITNPPDEETDPEFAMLKAKLAARMPKDLKADDLTLVDVTKEAVSLISEQLMTVTKAVVDTSKADYAVVTGVQIHSTSGAETDGEPVLEFVAPSKAYAVVGGVEKSLSLGLSEDGAATVDAKSNEIEELKKMVEAQSATIAALQKALEEKK